MEAPFKISAGRRSAYLTEKYGSSLLGFLALRVGTIRLFNRIEVIEAIRTEQLCGPIVGKRDLAGQYELSVPVLFPHYLGFIQGVVDRMDVMTHGNRIIAFYSGTCPSACPNYCLARDARTVENELITQI
jgi:hypothetical protein